MLTAWGTDAGAAPVPATPATQDHKCAGKPDGTACSEDGNPCTLDRCNGSSNACQHPVGNAGAVCRPAAGDCDVSETCTGSSTTCPANAFASASTVCRAAAGDCDEAERCPGDA